MKLDLLILEDRDDDERLLLLQLRRSGFEVRSRREQTAAGMRAALQAQKWDLICSDFSMPQFSALDAIQILRELDLDVPLIVVSGTIGEETAVGCFNAGANDFILKGSLARLGPAIERELRDAKVRRERRSAEEALRKKEEQYRRIVETAHEGIWTIDVEGRTTFMNARMSELLGVDAEASIGGSVYEFLDAENRAIYVEKVLNERKRHSQKFELRLRRRDGTEFVAEVRGAAITDDNGAHLGALTMIADVTEQRKAQASLMVSDRMASVGILAAGIAHEINNPLAAVIANLELAIAELDEARSLDRPMLREVLKEAHEASDRLRQIVRDVKIFSRADEDVRGQLDVCAVLESSTRMAWNEIRHRARLVKEYATIPPIEGNESRLGQVFLNLIVNAAQAIPEGRAADNQLKLATRTGADGSAVVEISDTGCGMSEEVQRRLFTPFFTTKPPGVGTGLGLSICHRIISALGGKIEVDSALGVGSTFRVVLPASAAVAAPRWESSGSRVPVAQRARVLAIDDEPKILSALRRALEPRHEVVTATGAREAFGLICEGSRFDVILCDLMMPDITGMEFHAELMKKAPDQAERIVFMTGGAFTARARKFLDTVSNRVLEKPFERGALDVMIARIARQPS